MSPLERWLTPAVRRWLYGIATGSRRKEGGR